MKKYLILFNFPALLIPQGISARKKNKVIFENIEWTNISIPEAEKTISPSTIYTQLPSQNLSCFRMTRYITPRKGTKSSESRRLGI
jgi:hypothetical protein